MTVAYTVPGLNGAVDFALRSASIGETSIDLPDNSTVADAYSARTGLAIQRDAIELYRLGWDLAEIAIYISDFRRTHTETNDTRTAWTNLQHFLDPSRW